MLFWLVSVLLSGCGLFKSDEQEFTEIVTDFLDAANQNDTKKIEKLFAKNVIGKEYEKDLNG